MKSRYSPAGEMKNQIGQTILNYVNVTSTLKKTDWTLLRNQKATLISVIDYLEDNLHESEGSPDVPKQDILHLEGLLGFLDALQDAAKLDGYPVKFLTQVPAKMVKRG